MDDKEKFELEISKVIPALNFIWHEESGQYLPVDTQLCWIAWQVAKRSQPIVKIDMLSRYGSTDDILACISAAGIKYTIGE